MIQTHRRCQHETRNDEIQAINANKQTCIPLFPISLFSEKKFMPSQQRNASVCHLHAANQHASPTAAMTSLSLIITPLQYYSPSPSNSLFPAHATQYHRHLPFTISSCHTLPPSFSSTYFSRLVKLHGIPRQLNFTFRRSDGIYSKFD